MTQSENESIVFRVISICFIAFSEKIRVGKDFQAVCPEMVIEKKIEMVGNDRALLVWSPTKDIPDSKRKFFWTTFNRFVFNIFLSSQSKNTYRWPKKSTDTMANRR